MMLSGTISMLDALMVSISSMLVVFAVLLFLFVIVRLFPFVFKAAAPQQIAPPAQEEPCCRRMTFLRR